MASAPAFASTPVIGVASVSTANANRDGTGTIATVVAAAPAAGRRIERIVIAATNNPADSIVTIFLHDGTTFWYFDEFDIGDPAPGSATVSPYRIERAYNDLVLPQNWTLRAAITAAPTAGVVNVFAFGGDLT